MFSRSSPEHSRITDQEYAVIARHGSVMQGAGVLSKKPISTPRTILVALDLLEQEGKIVRRITPKDVHERPGAV
jgi:hypothetical protein